ncbi:MAG TPA: ABC transporter permease subunit [Acholeplasma sp.]|nr:ABC transporter permease subunit [Acholeplasma sp.]
MAIITFSLQSDLTQATIETLYLLLISFLISLPLGTIVGFILALYGKNRPYQNKWIASFLSISVSIIRSIPFILLMILIIPVSYTLFGTSIGFIPSILSLSLIGIATVARLVEQSIIDLNPYIFDLAYAYGASKFQLFRYFIFKEAKSSLILGYTSSLISLLAYSTVVYIIGGGGLGFTAIQMGYYSPVGEELMWFSIIIIILLVQFIQLLGSILANHYNKKKKKGL